MSRPGHDAYDANGDVQIKMTAGTSVAMYDTCDRLVVLRVVSPEEAEIVYDGPGRPVWEKAGKKGKNGQRVITLSRLPRHCRDGSSLNFKLRTTKVLATVRGLVLACGSRPRPLQPKFTLPHSAQQGRDPLPTSASIGRAWKPYLQALASIKDDVRELPFWKNALEALREKRPLIEGLAAQDESFKFERLALETIIQVKAEYLISLRESHRS